LRDAPTACAARQLPREHTVGATREFGASPCPTGRRDRRLIRRCGRTVDQRPVSDCAEGAPKTFSPDTLITITAGTPRSSAPEPW
jgi:hypothetical protein